MLLRSLGSLDGLDQLGNDLEQVAHDTVVSHLEDGSGIVLVHGDDALEIGIASWNAPPEKVLIYAGFRGFENEKIFEFSPSVLPIFQSGLGEDTTWRVVRVVEGATLEKSCAARHLGFESLTLRQPEKPVLPASLFYSRFPIPKPASIASAEITFELYSRCA